MCGLLDPMPITKEDIIKTNQLYQENLSKLTWLARTISGQDTIVITNEYVRHLVKHLKEMERLVK